MAVKILTGLILAGAIIAAVLLAPFWAVAAILAVFIAGAAWEFAALGGGRTIDSVVTTVGTLAAVAVSVFFDDASFGFALAQTVFIAGMTGLIVVLLRPAPIESAGRRAAGVVAGIVYIGVAGALAVRLVRPESGFNGSVDLFGRWALLTAAVITWLNDTMAYFGGKLLGRHKMYPAISPNKTWEGSVTGMLGSIGGAFLIQALMGISYPPLQMLGLAFVGGMLGQVGDLVESMFKRSAGVKDSGRLLPGHGGMLDRIDAFLFVAPFTWLWLFVWFKFVR